MDADVIVVGAGLSGLCAAKLLKETGLSVLVLEARDRVGGRTWTKPDPRTKYCDMGAGYVGPTQDRIFRLAKEFGIENYKVNEVEDLLFYKDGQRVRFKPNTLPIPWNPFVAMDINNLFYLIDKLADEVPPEAPWKAPHAEEWDTMTLKEFINENCWTTQTKELFNGLINVVLCSNAYEASLLGFLMYIKQAGGSKKVFSTTNGSQERKFKGGMQQISTKVAEKLGKSVILSSPVAEVNQESKDVVRVKTLNGSEYKSKYVILALPPVLQMKIHFTPQTPPLHNQMIQRAPIGTVYKCHVYYSTEFWKQAGYCGSFIIDCGGKYPMFVTLCDTKPDGSHPALTVLITADHARRLVDKTAEERKMLIAESIEKATECKEALNPIHYEEKNWMDEQYSGGGYAAMYPPGFLTRYGRALRTPIDRMFFASTETAVEWSGYMEGAIEAGERAAREILHAMGKITADKIFQKEPPSEDVIFKPFETSLAERLLPSVPQFLKGLSISAVALFAVAVMMCPIDHEYLLSKCQTLFAHK